MLATERRSLQAKKKRNAKKMDLEVIETATSPMRRERSTTELQAHFILDL